MNNERYMEEEGAIKEDSALLFFLLGLVFVVIIGWSSVSSPTNTVLETNRDTLNESQPPMNYKTENPLWWI